MKVVSTKNENGEEILVFDLEAAKAVLRMQNSPESLAYLAYLEKLEKKEEEKKGEGK